MTAFPPSATRVVRLVVIVEGGMALLAVAGGPLLGRSLWDQLQCQPLDLAWGLGASIPMLAALGLMMRFPIGPLRRLLELSRELIVPLFRECSAAQLALVGLLAGVGEELFFRGFAQQALVEWLGPIAGVLIVSLAFGLMHALTPTYAVLAALVGVYLGVLCLATGNLVAAILAHAIYDFAALWWLTRRGGQLVR